MTRPPLLGVNIDHAATLRQARYRGMHASPHAEPSPLAFAREALAGGADGLTVHLREDRRHIQEDDVRALAALPGARLNLELACTPWMTEYARRLRPAAACLVPESREEVTTEGGLDVAGQRDRVAATVAALAAAGIEVSLFIGPETAQVDAAVAVGAPVIELHTPGAPPRPTPSWPGSAPPASTPTAAGSWSTRATASTTTTSGSSARSRTCTSSTSATPSWRGRC
jgi:pyridoxine 5-phosphate synthase